MRETFMIYRFLVAFSLLFFLAGFAQALTMEPPKQESSPIPVPASLMCMAGPDAGPCKGRIEKYYYDEKDDTCKPFFWGGCQGRVPFESMKACEAACEGKALRVVQRDTQKLPVYAEMTFEIPITFRNTEFAVSVDGKTVGFQQGPITYTNHTQSRTLSFFPGAPGEKQVTVIAISGDRIMHAKKRFYWQGLPFVALVNHFGDGELITKKTELSVVAFNTDDVRITFNGVAVNPDFLGQEAKIYTFQPLWTAGTNELAIHGKSSDGKPVSQRYSFLYAENGVVRQGEKMFIRYDDNSVKGKSGPWFDVRVEGDAVRAAKRGRTVKTCVLKDDGWLTGRDDRILELNAVAPGTATVFITRNARFLESPENVQEIVLKVLSSAGEGGVQ